MTITTSETRSEAVRGDELWVWQERTPEGWGTIVAYIPGLNSVGPLMSRVENIAAEIFKPIAEGHVRGTGNALRLAHFTLADAS